MIEITCRVESNEYCENNARWLTIGDCHAEIRFSRIRKRFCVFCSGEHFGHIGIPDPDPGEKYYLRELYIKSILYENDQPRIFIFWIDECP